MVIIVAVLLYHSLGYPWPHPLSLLCLVPELVASTFLRLASLTPFVQHQRPSLFLGLSPGTSLGQARLCSFCCGLGHASVIHTILVVVAFLPTHPSPLCPV